MPDHAGINAAAGEDFYSGRTVVQAIKYQFTSNKSGWQAYPKSPGAADLPPPALQSIPPGRLPQGSAETPGQIGTVRVTDMLSDLSQFTIRMGQQPAGFFQTEAIAVLSDPHAHPPREAPRKMTGA